MHPADATITRLASSQKELVTREALLDAQLTRRAIEHRLEAGDLTRVHRGVYTTARSPLTFEQRALAAVLACGPGTALGDGWAAGLWRMLTEPPGPPEVRREGEHRAGPAGVRLRRSNEVDRTIHRGVPVTTPAQTLLHLATTGPLGRLELALNEALAMSLVTRNRLEALAASGRHGSRAIRSLLEEAVGFTRQEAERRLRSLILKAQLPTPLLNAEVLGAERDVLWPEHRLVVEIDGWAGHGTRRAFEADRARDAQLLALGYRTLRITWRQLTEEPEALIARIAASLARSAS